MWEQWEQWELPGTAHPPRAQAARARELHISQPCPPTHLTLCFAILTRNANAAVSRRSSSRVDRDFHVRRRQRRLAVSHSSHTHINSPSPAPAASSQQPAASNPCHIDDTRPRHRYDVEHSPSAAAALSPQTARPPDTVPSPADAGPEGSRTAESQRSAKTTVWL